MYTPRLFFQNEHQEMLRLISDYPFATIVSIAEGAVDANHIPLIVREDSNGALLLQGHFARANPICDTIDGQSVLAMFHGPHCYISPSAYPTKQAHGKVVPTWNYAVVHVRGQIRVVQDSDWKREFLDRLTALNERFEHAPWAVSDAPKEFIDSQLEPIAGFEIEVERLEGKWKMSQNQPRQNREGVVAALRTRGDDASRRVADLVGD